MDKPQIIAHVQKSLNYTLFDTKWIPRSAKFVVLGNHARGTGALQIYEVSHGNVQLAKEVIIISLVQALLYAFFFFLNKLFKVLEV